MKTKIKISKKWLLLLIVLVVLLVLFADTVFAQAPTAPTAAEAYQTFLRNINNMLVTMLKVLQKILWPVFLMIGGLLNNDILFGYGMEERTYEVWVQIRNFVNIGFVLILLGIAIYNVTGFAKDNYELKTFLPKFAIALIAVNFSYIAMKVILDATNVLTTAVFTLPASVSEDLQQTGVILTKVPEGQGANYGEVSDTKGEKYYAENDMVQKICTSFFGKTKTFIETYKKIEDMGPENREKRLMCNNVGEDKYKFTKQGVDMFKRYSSQNAALVMALQFMNIIEVDKVSEALKAKKIDIATMAFNLLFSVILYIVYGAAYVALLAVLLVRLVVLWILLALSPIIAITLVLPNMKLGEEDVKDVFIQHTIVPLKIGVYLTLGYMFLEQYKAAKPSDIAVWTYAKQGMNLEISGLSDIQAMVIAFAAVAVVWIGVFSAAEKTMAKGITGWIKGKLSALGQTAAGLVKFAPLIPSEKGEKGRISAYELGHKIMAPYRSMEQAAYARVTAGEATITPKQIRLVGRRGTATALGKMLQQAQQRIHVPGTRKAVGLALAAAAKRPQTRRLAQEALQRLGFGPSGKGWVSTARYARGLEELKTRRLITPLGAVPRRPGAGKPGAKGKPTGVDAHSAIDDHKGRHKGKGSAAWAALDKPTRDKLEEWAKKRHAIFVGTDKSMTLSEQDGKLDETKNKDMKRGLNTLYAANASNLGKVDTNAGAYKGIPEDKVKTVDETKRKALEDSLKSASRTLKDRKVSDKRRKAILENVVLKALGVKKDDPGYLALKRQGTIGKYLP